MSDPLLRLLFALGVGLRVLTCVDLLFERCLWGSLGPSEDVWPAFLSEIFIVGKLLSVTHPTSSSQELRCEKDLRYLLVPDDSCGALPNSAIVVVFWYCRIREGKTSGQLGVRPEPSLILRHEVPLEQGEALVFLRPGFVRRAFLLRASCVAPVLLPPQVSGGGNGPRSPRPRAGIVIVIVIVIDICYFLT